MYPHNHVLMAPPTIKPNSDSRAQQPTVLNNRRQRQRLVRRSHLTQSAAETASESPVVDTTIGTPYEAMRTATSPGKSQSTVDLTSSLGPGDTSTSPTPMSASVPIAATPRKKKLGLLPLKPTKDYDPSDSVAITSPLPPMTPSKAKQLLGFDADEAPISGDTPGSPSAKVVSNRTTRFKEEDVAPDPPKKSSIWSSSNKALKILDVRPRQAKHAEDEENEEYVAAVMWSSPTKETEFNFNSHPDARFDGLIMAPRTDAEPSRRQRRKKGPKLLDRMAPITETSHDGLNTTYRKSESKTELDAISEYEAPSTPPPRSASSLPRSQTESSLISIGPFKLSESDISPSDRDDKDEKNTHIPHPGTPVDLNRLRWKEPDAPQWRSPLQNYEGRLLDDAEEHLIHQQVKVSRHQAAKIELDDHVAALKTSHASFKREFEAVKEQSSAPEHDHASEAENSDDDDLISIRSSIGLDEEPVVCTAQAMTTTVATGLVKTIVIGKRKPSLAPPNHTFENSAPVAPTHLRNMSYNRLTKDAKPKMPRNESQLLVQDWVTKHDRIEQRPVSERVDPDVLADQEIPPAPFPKEGPVSPHPPRTSSKHHCLQSGHIFRPVNLKQVPDEVSINSLEVRPYLQTHSGMKQHVHVPLACGRCGEDVDEQMWECRIPICHVAVCALCAVNMQIEHEGRAIASQSE
ncbi:hypothetical protein J1614_005899 [Plenodomus biglobosus]|nr:hypothetical protein J1614_005899 [Plenodomus biglobosus]